MTKADYRELDAEAASWRREKAAKIKLIMAMFDASSALGGGSAIRGMGPAGLPWMAIKSGELSDRAAGNLRVTFFGPDGPHTHSTRRSEHEIAEETVVWLSEPIEPMSEADVIAWTTTPEYERGSRVVAFVQAENLLRWHAQRAGRYDWATEVIQRANDVGTEGGKHRGTPETLDAALDILALALRELPKQNPRGLGQWVQNPPWVTKALADSYETISGQVPAAWLPRLSDVGSVRSTLVAHMLELGCGAYGCVLPTLDPGTVLKVTTDTTEAEFAAELAEGLEAPIVVEYKTVIRLSGHHDGRPIFLLWREAADAVGQLRSELGVDADAYVHKQHTAAQEALRLIVEGRSLRIIRPKLLHWLETCEAMANQRDIPELRPLGRGLVAVYRASKIFFGDVHVGNLGRVTRNGKPSWVITDPGNVVVIDVL